MEPKDETTVPMPAPVDVRDGLENRRQRAAVEAALFDEPVAPIKIGRFTVVRLLGAGGMGVVYMAYDEELDRRVAVKLLHGTGEPGGDAQARLQREAQAMARLSHPNVVAVHDVGTFDGQVFVAMEFVAGHDLRSWLRAEPRGWPEVLARFVQAGEGLCAAHEAGLVHRDFKPDNVLVGDDGRVRVADFGLAHQGVGPAEAIDGSVVEDLDVALTKTGAILGTPAYMAPEQVRGERADARADQFGFCVALYEGLFGQRPFKGPTLTALALAVEEGDIQPGSEKSDVPAWLRAAVRRGLAADPSARWSSMRELLDALTDDPQARRRRRIRVTSALVLVLAAIAGTSWLAIDGIQQGARQRFWAALNEQRLELERERSTRQAQDDKVRAQDSARMVMVDRYQPDTAPSANRDPTVAAALLRDVEGEARTSPQWIAQANVVLGQPISWDVLTEHRAVVSTLVFAPGEPVLYSASGDGTVRRTVVGGEARSDLVVRHEQAVTALALDPGGHMLASGSADHEVVLWPTDGTAAPRRLLGHTAPIKALAFDPAGRRLASASDDGTARLWPVEGGEPLILGSHEGGSHEGGGHGGGVLMVAFDPTGSRVLTTSRDATARVWDAADGTPLVTLRGHVKSVFHARFVDERRVVTAADDGTARLWRLDQGASPQSEVLVRHEGAITSLDAHGDRFVTTAEDGRPRVWGLEGGDEIVLPGHQGVVWSGRLTPDGRRVATVGWDGDARLHAVDGRGGSVVLAGHRSRMTSVAIHPAGRWLATGSFDGMIRLWDLEQPRTRWVLRGHRDQVWSAALDPSGERVATASHDGTARIWRIEDGAALGVLRAPQASEEPLTAVAFAPNGRALATGSSRGRVLLWELQTGRSRELVGHDRDVWHLVFDTEGRRLASASHDGTVRIWDVGTGQVVQVLAAGGERPTPAKVSRVMWTDDDTRLVTADLGGTVRLWDAATFELLGSRRAHEAGIVEMVLGPDGRMLATASVDGTARLWSDIMGGEPVVLEGHERAVSSVAFDPLGQRMVTASEDGTARVWDLEGRPLFTLAGHAAELWSARFSSDGRWVLTASDDGTIRAWVPGEVEGAVAQWSHDGPVLGLWLALDGQRLISTSSDATTRLWGLDGLETDPLRLGERLARATRYCIPAALRMRLLGEDRVEAAAAAARCRG